VFSSDLELKQDGKHVQGILMNFETGRTTYWHSEKGVVKTIENDKRQEEYKISKGPSTTLFKTAANEQIAANTEKATIAKSVVVGATRDADGNGRIVVRDVTPDIRLEFAKMARAHGLNNCKAEISRNGEVNRIPRPDGKGVAGVYELRPDGKGILMNFETKKTVYWEKEKGVIKTVDNDKRQELYKEQGKLPTLIRTPLDEKYKTVERRKELEMSR
jgi:hypothetical protein